MALLLASPLAFSAPQGGVVTSGLASIAQSGATTNINQSSQKASINWQGFSVAAGETINFNQPNASAVTLNRVVGNEKSVIDGALNANGQVFLINSNGVLFNQGSSVNVGGLVASTLELGDADFQAGRYSFTKSSSGSGSVVNMGTINAREGGYVALLGPQVGNEGVIVARKGTVALAGGDKVSLDFNGDSLLKVTIDQGTLDALVENKGAIYADGGTVILTARAADDLLGAQVNNSGIVQARTIGDLKGSVALLAEGGTTTVGGTLDASAPTGGGGGAIETSGNTVKVADSALVTTASALGTTGHWLIDPDGFTIANSGGDISATVLSTLLGNNNITLQSTSGSGTGGDINVNSAVNWSGNTLLTLTATRNINVNASITATGASAGLALNYGGDYNILTPATYSGTVLDANGTAIANVAPAGTVYASITLSGANATLNINGTAYTLVHNMAQLAALDDANGTATGNYAIVEDIDASATPYTTAVVAILSGNFAGLGHTISNLTITGAATAQNIALIGQALSGSIIRDIGLLNVNIAGKSQVGALLAFSKTATVSKSYSTGTVKGYSNVGGLVGANQRGQVLDSFSTAAVENSEFYGSGGSALGGLIGNSIGGVVSNSHAAGSVTVISTVANLSVANVGGLIGSDTAPVTNSYATGNVLVSSPTASASNLGGLIGNDSASTGNIINSFATGDVTGGSISVGGLVGAFGGGAITNSYAAGNVAGSMLTSSSSINGIGGLVGTSQQGTVITNSFATGNVSGTSEVGGLLGDGVATISGSYATGNVIAEFSGGGLVGGLAGGSISNSYATGNVSGREAGGLVGGNAGTITGSYATGDVTGSTVDGVSNALGGLVGTNAGTISNSEASGNVAGGVTAGTNYSGGLVGTNLGGAVITNSSATGSVSGTGVNVGGVTGLNKGTSTNNTYDDIAADKAAAAAAAQAAAAAAQAAAVTAAQKAAAQAAADAANRAAAQAAAEAAAQAAAYAQAASNQGNTQASDIQRHDDAVPSTAVAAQASRPAPVDANIVFADPSRFSAGVRRIEVDGQVYELEGEDKNKPARDAVPHR